MDDEKGSRRALKQKGRLRRKSWRSKSQAIWRGVQEHRQLIFTGSLVLLMVVLLFGLFSLLQPPTSSAAPGGVTQVNYSDFVQQIRADNVLAVTFQDKAINGLLKSPLTKATQSSAPVSALAKQNAASDIALWNRYIGSNYTTLSGVNAAPPIDPARAIYTRLPLEGDAQLMPLLASKGIAVTTLPAAQSPLWVSIFWRMAPFLLFGLILILFVVSRNGKRSPRALDERITQLGRTRARRLERARENKVSPEQPGSRAIEKRSALTPPSSSSPASTIGTTSARVQLAPPVTFADVAGIDEVRTELEEIVQFLRSPERFKRLGARIPRGALLVGAPGTGKTLLARAVAGEAGVPFFSISASEFVEMFVGVGASRVRDLFNQARKSAPCVVFIDEIDAVGRKRSVRMSNNEERDQTLNQLLVELDGFDERQAVVVLAATNRVDILDKALLRPGRFDRHITVSVPDRVGRQAILTVHTRQTPLHEEVDLEHLARLTTGMSGADLANLVNEAALGAARRELDSLTQACFEEALSRVQLGALRPIVMSEHEKRIIAYHEGGHALVAYHLAEADTVNCVTILPRGQSLGVTQFVAQEDRYNHSRQSLMARIAVGLGGRVAEELTFGPERITTGAENDLQIVTDLARRMVTRWGMSEEIGVVFADYRADAAGAGLNMQRVDLDSPARAQSLIADANGRLFANSPRQARSSEPLAFAQPQPTGYSSGSATLAGLIDSEMQRILNEGRVMARTILHEHAEELVRIADALLDREHISRAEFEALLSS